MTRIAHLSTTIVPSLCTTGLLLQVSTALAQPQADPLPNTAAEHARSEATTASEPGAQGEPAKAAPEGGDRSQAEVGPSEEEVTEPGACQPCEECEPCAPPEAQVAAAVALSEQQSLEKYGVVFHSRPWEDREGDNNHWMRMDSGEWLQGELKNMREESLSFDSDEFDLQAVDWDDVAELHLPGSFDFVLEDKTVVSGPADMVGEKIMVHTSSGDVSLDQNLVMSVTQAHKRELSRWYFKLSAGASLRRGNTQSADYSAFSRLRREDPFNRATLDYNGQFGLVNDDVNTHKHRGDLDWNLFVSPVFFLTPVSAFALYDEFQNIELRIAAGAGGGVHIIDTSDVTFDFEVTAGYVNTRYISVEETADRTYIDGVLVVPSLTLEWDITDDVDFDLSWQSSLVATSIENSFHHGTARLSVEITDIFDLEASAIYDRQESPVAEEDGEVPLRNDLAMTLSAALEFE